MDVVRRWSAKNREFVEVSRPEAIRVYNSKMGGVDQLDMFIALYPMNFRTRRWPTRVILHLLGLAICNCWVQYRKRARLLSAPKRDIMDLLKFRENIAESLLKSESNSKRPVGRPSLASLLNYEREEPLKKARPAVLPVDTVRYDGFDHWPEPMELKSAQRCKFCTGSSRTRCVKCNVYLCLSKDKNCFMYFH